MTPVANFLVTPNLLSVQFTDSSTGTPTSWSWDFGDSTPPVTSQNPVHAYTNPGKYTVKLTSTNTDGVSSLQRIIMVSTVPILPVPILTFVNLKLLGNAALVTQEAKDAFIAEAQLIIQPLVDPEVIYADVFDETKYPALANALIAYLAVYSILSAMVAAATSNVAGTGNGVLKKITTGPSEVEYQDLFALAKTFFAKEGIGTTLQNEACALARRLNIWLPMCPGLPKPKFVDSKVGRKSPVIPESAWLQYPYLIPITC